MGIIINQSAKNLFTTYFGFAIGAVNTLFLYTNFLTPEYYGLVGFLLSAANLIWPFMAFGVANTLVKFYSSYKTKEEKDKLLNLVLLLPIFIGAVVGILAYISYDLLLNYFSDKNQLVKPFVWVIFVIAFATAYFELFFSWAKINYQSVLGNFMKEVFHRVCVSILLLFVYFSWINVESFIYFLASIYLLRMIIMGFYAARLYFPRISFEFPINKVSVFKYSALILLAGSVAMVLLDLDKVMIEYYMPIENVAVYAIAIYISSVIAVPSKAMHQITYPLTAMMLNQKDKPGLESLYKKSSINLLIVGGLIFLLILCNLEQLYLLIPPEYQISFSIIILISCVRLYDNLLGNINSILFNSDYYRLVLFIGIVLALLAVVLNILFIPEFGLFGAALATFLAFFGYNTAKLFVVLQKFRIHPFTAKTLSGIGLILLFSAVFGFWNFPFHPVINIILKSVLLGIGYTFLVFILNLSPDMSKLFQKYLRIK